MLTCYALYELDMREIKTAEDRFEALRKMPDKYFNKLKEVEAYCGGKLYRHRAGYGGIKGNIEYVAYKCCLD